MAFPMMSISHAALLTEASQAYAMFAAFDIHHALTF
jgi:hypothetical protein